MASLTYEELSIIMRIVNDNDSSLESNFNWFAKAFPKAEHVRVCCGLSILIHDAILVNKQRVVAAVILCGIHRNDSDYLNPFLNLLLETVQKYTTTTMEKSILSKLLKNPKYYTEIIKKTINQVFVEFSAKEAYELDTNDIQTLREQYEENGPPVIGMKTLGIPGVLSVSNHPTASVDDILTGSVGDSSREELYGTHWSEDELLEEARTLELLYNAETLRNSYLTPNFVQFCPGIMDVGPDELCWIDMPEPPLLVQLPAVDAISTENEDLISLLRSGCSEGFSPSQRTQLINGLKSGALSVKSLLSLTSENFPGLIENNWQVAANLLAKVVPSHPDVLRVMEDNVITFHSIEVFSALAIDIDLPDEFTRCYLSKCMQMCENTKNSRFLRVVCTLLQSFARKGSKAIHGLFPEIQSFCTTFAKAKVANELFGMIKVLESSSSSS